MSSLNAADRAAREQRMHAWLATVAPGATAPEPASSDASFRRYFRIKQAGESRIVMDAPPPQEDCLPFVRVAAMLGDWGVRAPRVLAQDLEQGFLLLTDLGSETYLDALATADPEPLYAAAIDTLLRMQAGAKRNGHGCPPYDRALLQYELDLFADWLLARHCDRPLAGSDRLEWDRTCEFLMTASLAQPRAFVHRDYHSRNLMWSPGQAPGVLDFQDAVDGPVSYDLVSLLRDCYVEWPDEQVAVWRDRFHDGARAAGLVDVDAGEFARWFDLTGVQRHLKAAGIFCRLNHRDGKAAYLRDVPRTLRYIVRVSRNYPELHWLTDKVAGLEFACEP